MRIYCQVYCIFVSLTAFGTYSPFLKNKKKLSIGLTKKWGGGILKKHIAKRKVNMKHKKIVSIIGTLILIISAVALITGCPQKTTAGKSGIIEFDSTRIECTKTNSFPYTTINNGDQIQENDRLLFQAILPPGKIVKNWYINDVKKEYATDPIMGYTVKASDFVSGKLKVRFDTKDPVQGTIEFDSTRVTCLNANSYTNITTGASVQESDKLRFEAILPTGKIVENWYINNVKQEDETYSWMRYTVQAADFKSGKIKIGVTFK